MTTQSLNKRKNGTQTSAFGTKGRINHDSSKFYNSKMYKGLSVKKDIEYIENQIASQHMNTIFCKSSEHMHELPDSSVHLMITSPPYNVGKEYDDDLSMMEYRNLLKIVLQETHRVLVPGGRVCINIANLGRKPYLPIHSYLIQDMHDIGFLMRGEILWDKGNSANASTAWGTYLKANNPVLRDIHEYILVFCKSSFSRPRTEKKSTISKDEFLEFTKSIWKFSTERASRIGHPAPFPVELPYRLIQLYSFENDIILDPFAGSGTSCIAALKTNRQYIAYDTNREYCNLAEQRIQQFIQENTMSS